MYLCYVDESGTSSIPGNTSHFILTGISIPIWHWRDSDRAISTIKNRYNLLDDAEIHTAWILRSYHEQRIIADFDRLSKPDRTRAVMQYRNGELLRLQRAGNSKKYRQVKKNYNKTKPYIHLTQAERERFILEVAECISNWGYARLFAECIDKVYFDPSRTNESVDEQAFTQIISRFERYLENIGTPANRCYGLIIHDNNETVARKHTSLMKKFHQRGTLWTNLNNIIETPLFVDSKLTSMVQIADLCGYAIRRYCENGEEELFNHIYKRADRFTYRSAAQQPEEVVVGVRHFSNSACCCKICSTHKYCQP